MTEQLDIFRLTENREGARRRDASPTSRAAAGRAKFRSGTKRTQVLLCLSTIRHRDGLTDEEMQLALVMGHNTQTARRRELVLDGFVEDSGRTRPTPSTGTPATVWVLTDKGRQAVAAYREEQG